MRHQVLLALSTLLSVAVATPQPADANIEASWTTTSTLSATLTFNFSTTLVTTDPGITTMTSTTSSSTYKPTYTATEVYAFKPNSPIHLLPFQAKGQIFRLHDSPGIYCPSFIERAGGCSMAKNITGINDCSLSVTVPGGQALYLAPDGQLRYTQAHSQHLFPPNSTICPLNFTRTEDSDATEVRPHGFGSGCFMACPMLDRTPDGIKQVWQVYANVPDMRPPLRRSNLSSCIDFQAVGFEKQLGHSAAAWQYI